MKHTETNIHYYSHKELYSPGECKATELSGVLEDFSQFYDLQTVTMLMNGVLSLCLVGGVHGQCSFTVFTVIGNTQTPMMSVMDSREHLY